MGGRKDVTIVDEHASAELHQAVLGVAQQSGHPGPFVLDGRLAADDPICHVVFKAAT